MKRPKVFWRNAGLVHAPLNVPDADALLVQPWVGASWEGYVIEQALGTLSSLGRNPNAYYFRTSDQYEIDPVLKLGTEIWAVEIKLTSSPTLDDMERLDSAARMIRAPRCFLVSRTRRPVEDGRRVSCDPASFLERLAQA